MPVRGVTFDAYNTLLDFLSGMRAELERILPPEGRAMLRSVARTMDEVVSEALAKFDGAQRADFPRFIAMADIHRACFAAAREQHVPSLDIDAATKSWNRYIARAPLYPDAQDAVERAAERYPVAIVSDIDTWMLESNPAVSRLPLRGFVTSEQDGSYKAMVDSTMFYRATELLGCDRSELVHVGDSVADVIGARHAGAKAIWIDRHGRGRPSRMPEPDATIHSLSELDAILERWKRDD